MSGGVPGSQGRGEADGRDACWMAMAVAAARRAWGWTAPNPAVGCVLVRDGAVLAVGWHEAAGKPHAEAHALAQAGADARGATAYVTLEPCNHTGRTGPCTEALLTAGVSRVVIGALDPNPHVRGGGVERLRAAGITVDVGVWAPACEALLAPFRRAVVDGLPWVTLKLATTLDARLADASGRPAWITGPSARAWVARQRERSDAVLVGVGTALADDPWLTARPEGRDAVRQPVPIVFDSHLRLSPSARLARSGTWVVAVEEASTTKQRRLEERGVFVVRVGSMQGRVDLHAAMAHIAQAGMHVVFAEGGPTLGAALVRAGLVQRVSVHLAPALAGAPHGLAWPESLGVLGLDAPLRLHSATARRMGEDVVIEGDLIPLGSVR